MDRATLYCNFKVVSLLIIPKIRAIKSNNNKTRLYTTVISFTESNINLRKEVISFFQQKIGKSFMKASQKEKKEILIQKPELTDQTLPLIIKKYKFPEAFSEFIHNDKNSSFSFEIQGPHVNYILKKL